MKIGELYLVNIQYCRTNWCFWSNLHFYYYCDRIIGDIETNIGTKLANYRTFILIKNQNLSSFWLNSKMRKTD